MTFVPAAVQSHRVRSGIFLLAVVLTAGGDAVAQTTKAYVATTGANSVVVVDTDAESVAGIVAAGTGPTRVAVSRDGTRVCIEQGF